MDVFILLWPYALRGHAKIPDKENIVETKANTSCGQLLYFSGDLNGHFAGDNFVIFIAKSGGAIK